MSVSPIGLKATWKEVDSCRFLFIIICSAHSRCSINTFEQHFIWNLGELILSTQRLFLPGQQPGPTPPALASRVHTWECLSLPSPFNHSPVHLATPFHTSSPHLHCDTLPRLSVTPVSRLPKTSVFFHIVLENLEKTPQRSTKLKMRSPFPFSGFQATFGTTEFFSFTNKH